jgi:uncharacterized membrane protein (Fun14 family)
MSDEKKADKVHKSDPRKHFFKHVAAMPMWHKAVMIVAALMAIAGLAGTLYAKSGGDAHVQVVKVNTPPSNGKNAVNGKTESKEQVESKQSMGSISELAPGAMAIGFGVLAGFVLGWFLRSFLAVLAVLTMSTIAGFWILSYFGVLHPENWNPEAFRGKSAEAATWMTVYAKQLKDLAFNHLACTSASAFAACLGFRRI